MLMMKCKSSLPQNCNGTDDYEVSHKVGKISLERCLNHSLLTLLTASSDSEISRKYVLEKWNRALFMGHDYVVLLIFAI